jgi:RNA polymerase sigma factor for flagellar operon FliA
MEIDLKAGELQDLWRRYKSDGDVRVREHLVVAYSPLVKYVVGRTAAGLPPHLEEADLISYGLVGLISAIERFDLSRDIKFETYAIMRIKGAIIDELRSLDWVPRSVRARAREVERANAKLEHTLQRAPTDGEIAAEMGITVEDLNESLLAISRSSIIALDELWSASDSSGDQVSLMDTIEDPGAPDLAKALDLGDLMDRIADSIAKLPEREKLVIALYYYENLTLREIGEVLGVTESRISQMHTKAVLRMRSRASDAETIQEHEWTHSTTPAEPAPEDFQPADPSDHDQSYESHKGLKYGAEARKSLEINVDAVANAVKVALLAPSTEPGGSHARDVLVLTPHIDLIPEQPLRVGQAFRALVFVDDQPPREHEIVSRVHLDATAVEEFDVRVWLTT